MPDSATTAGLTTVTALSLFAVLSLARSIRHRRGLTLLATLPCPQCRSIYGPAILKTFRQALSRVHYYWVPLRGRTVSSLDLPATTVLVKCPRCDSETEFRENGDQFLHPHAGLCGYTRLVNPEPKPPTTSHPPHATRSGKYSNIVKLATASPVLIVENSDQKLPLLSQGFRNAGFTDPIVTLPDDRTVGLYLDGVGIYSNRKKYPRPILILQDLTLPKSESELALSWLHNLRTCRHVVITYPTGVPNTQHFESAVAFGLSAILCKLEFPDSLDAMFRGLHRACIED
jgi:hypothetical protein